MRPLDQRGVVFPSPVMILSIIAVAMAGIAWVATRHTAPTERLVEPAEGERLARGAAGDHRDGPHHLRQVHQDGGRIRVDVGDLGVVDDRGQGAVVVQAHHRGGRHGDQRGVPLFGLRGREPHGVHPITSRSASRRRSASGEWSRVSGWARRAARSGSPSAGRAASG